MPDRMVREGLLASRKWAGLKLHLQNLFVRLILAADDYGTFPANPALIRSRCYPLELERAREADLQRWLDELEHAGLVRFHWHRDDRYLTLEKFGQAERLKHPRAKYPRSTTDGEAPDVSGQVVLPFAEDGPPGGAPAPTRGDFSAPKPLKRREETTPHSPPPTGGGKISLPGPAEAPRARTPRRFRSPQRAAEEITRLQAEIGRLREEMRDIYYPGGCAHKVVPSGEKAAKADRLRARWDECEREIERLEHLNTPEKTGGTRQPQEVGA